MPTIASAARNLLLVMLFAMASAVPVASLDSRIDQLEQKIAALVAGDSHMATKAKVRIP